MPTQQVLRSKEPSQLYKCVVLWVMLVCLSLCGHVHMSVYVFGGQSIWVPWSWNYRHVWNWTQSSRAVSTLLSFLSLRGLDFVVEMKFLIPLLPRFILDIEGELFYIRKPRAVIIFPFTLRMNESLKWRKHGYSLIMTNLPLVLQLYYCFMYHGRKAKATRTNLLGFFWF